MYVYLWLIHVLWQKATQHCKAIILQLKKKQQTSTRASPPDPQSRTLGVDCFSSSPSVYLGLGISGKSSFVHIQSLGVLFKC